MPAGRPRWEEKLDEPRFQQLLKRIRGGAPKTEIADEFDVTPRSVFEAFRRESERGRLMRSARSTAYRRLRKRALAGGKGSFGAMWLIEKLDPLTYGRILPPGIQMREARLKREKLRAEINALKRDPSLDATNVQLVFERPTSEEDSLPVEPDGASVGDLRKP